MPISISSKGSFEKTERFLKAMEKLDIAKIISAQGEVGVRALSEATPRDSGRTASSWGYRVEKKGTSVSIVWTNSDEENGFPVAVMIQYGHGTGTGGYVQGIDFINPAMRPIFERIADTVWKAVKSA